MLLTEREHMAADIDSWADKYGRDRKRIDADFAGNTEEIWTDLQFPHAKSSRCRGYSPCRSLWCSVFYSFLYHKPHGKFVISLCQTITCDMLGKDRVARQLENDLGIKFGETTEDGMFTLEWTNCLGMCDQGPAMKVNDQIFTQIDPTKVCEIIEGCRKALQTYQTDRKEQLV